MIRWTLLLLTLALALVACGNSPASGGNATPLEATVVIMGERVEEDNVTVTQYPACLGVAVGPELLLTSDHCLEGIVDGAHVVVTNHMWVTTVSGNVLADTIRVRGEVRELKPRKPVDAWTSTAAAGSGSATRVVVRDSEMVEIDTTLDGDQFTGDADPGDSGGPFFQGSAVGLTQTCHGTAEGVCDIDGGRFSAP